MIKLAHAFPALTPNQAFHQELLKKFKATVDREDIGFYRHSSDRAIATTAKTTARRFAHKRRLVHVGIGGSSLGPEMLLSALGVSADKRVQFINNIDTDMLVRQQRDWDINETFFYIVSKSGNTAETLAALSIILSWLEKHKVTAAQWKEFIVVCTDPKNGDLRKFARDHQLSCLDVPPSIGGRFSVLTDVGLFTAAWAGISVDQLLHGAEAMKANLLEPQAEKNLLTQMTFWLEEQRKAGRTLTVLMPYSSLLKEFTAWWVQLWAESLGKDGKGLTPVMSYGATDQHSQMQLFMQGPADKTMLLLGIEKSEHSLPLKNSLKYPHLEALAPFTLSELMKAEHAGTLKALEEEGRPLLDLRLQQFNADTLGQLILFFESLTVSVGITLGVDPFNQPGVEAGKKYAHDWLGQHAP